MHIATLVTAWCSYSIVASVGLSDVMSGLEQTYCHEGSPRISTVYQEVGAAATGLQTLIYHISLLVIVPSLHTLLSAEVGVYKLCRSYPVHRRVFSFHGGGPS